MSENLFWAVFCMMLSCFFAWLNEFIHRKRLERILRQVLTEDNTHDAD